MMLMTDVFNAASIAQLVASVAATGPFDGAKLGLYTNNILPTKNMLLAALTEAAYTGYARQTFVPSVPGRDQNGNVGVFSSRLVWQQTGSPVSVTIYGLFLVDSTGMILYGVEPLSVPVTLVDIVDYFATVSEFLGTNTQQGNTTVVE